MEKERPDSCNELQIGHGYVSGELVLDLCHGAIYNAGYSPSTRCSLSTCIFKLCVFCTCSCRG